MSMGVYVSLGMSKTKILITFQIHLGISNLCCMHVNIICICIVHMCNGIEWNRCTLNNLYNIPFETSLIAIFGKTKMPACHSKINVLAHHQPPLNPPLGALHAHVCTLNCNYIWTKRCIRKGANGSQLLCIRRVSAGIVRNCTVQLCDEKVNASLCIRKAVHCTVLL